MAEKNRILLLASNLSGAFPIIASFFESRPKGRLLFIPTAAVGEGWFPIYEEDVKPFEAMGFAVTMCDVSQYDPFSEHFLEGYDAIYLSGGNAFFLLKHLKRTGLFGQIQDHVQAGSIIYMGSSAGSVVATPDIGYADSLDDRSFGDGDDVGFGFVDFAIFPHMDHPTMGEPVRKAFKDFHGQGRDAVGMNDGQIILVTGADLSVIG